MVKMREEFEKVLANCQSAGLISGWHDTSFSDEGDCYISNTVDDMFQMFKASRAALVVELPERVLVESSAVDDEYDLHDLDAYYEPNDIHTALDKAGIKYE